LRTGGVRLAEVKSHQARRALAPPLVDLLRVHRAAQAAERLARGKRWRDWEHELVFIRPSGLPVAHRQDWQEWADILAEIGIDHVKVHAARHTAAPLNLEAGVSMRVVMETLGHSTIALTANTLQHVADALKADAAARVADAPFPGSQARSQSGRQRRTRVDRRRG
jgi:integrase